MPDITWTGGISELKKICTQAETYYIPVSPHDASGPINVIAGAQVMITVPNCYRVETSRADLHAYDCLMDVPLDIRGDKIHLDPDRPGIGIELAEDAQERYPPVSREVETRLHVDGSVVDQ